jgi:hypothetical protein
MYRYASLCSIFLDCCAAKFGSSRGSYELPCIGNMEIYTANSKTYEDTVVSVLQIIMGHNHHIYPGSFHKII